MPDKTVHSASRARNTVKSKHEARRRTLHHVNLQVADVSRAEDYYRQLFGFEPSRIEGMTANRLSGPREDGSQVTTKRLLFALTLAVMLATGMPLGAQDVYNPTDRAMRQTARALVQRRPTLRRLGTPFRILSTWPAEV
jgi:glyoxalase/bleomycin resistance protein/dioxygenase superfamily protein